MGFAVAAKAIGSALKYGAEAGQIPGKAAVAPPVQSAPAVSIPPSPQMQIVPQPFPTYTPGAPPPPLMSQPGLLGMRDPNGPNTPSLMAPPAAPQFNGVPDQVSGGGDTADAGSFLDRNKSKVKGLLSGLFSGAGAAGGF